MDENLMPQGVQTNAGTLGTMSFGFTFCCKLTTNLFPDDRNVESFRFRIFSGGGSLSSSCTSMGGDAESPRISSSPFDSVS